MKEKKKKADAVKCQTRLGVGPSTRPGASRARPSPPPFPSRRAYSFERGGSRSSGRFEGMEAKERLARARIDFVERCLGSGSGCDRDYARLVDQVKKGGAAWLHALSEKASLIRPAHTALAKAILAFAWYSSCKEERKACSHLLINLATAHPNYLTPILSAVINNLNIASPLADPPKAAAAVPLSPSPNSVEALDSKVSSNGGSLERPGSPVDASAPDVDGSEAGATHAMLHATLSSILRLRPTAGLALFPILVRRFPYVTRPPIEQRLYVKNLLRITEYAPQLRDRILLLLIEKIVELDATVSPHLVRGPGPPMPDPATTDAGSVASGGSSSTASSVMTPAARLAGVRAGQAASLNGLLEMLLQYLKLVLDKAEDRVVSAVFRSLLLAFSRSIVKTYQIACVQHVLLYVCARRTAFAEAFLRFLVARTAARDVSPIERQAASAYAGGFLVRCQSLRQATCLSYFKQLSAYARSYSRTHREQVRSALLTAQEGAVHIAFYGVCQALFYVFTRRHSLFMALQRDIEDEVAQLGLDELVESNLNPLRFVNPDIVRGFVLALLRLNLYDCRMALEFNARFPPVRVALKGKNGPGGARSIAQRVIQSLDFLPFDPCPIAAVSSYLTPELYRTDDELERELSPSMLSNSPLLSPKVPPLLTTTSSPATAACRTPRTPALTPGSAAANTPSSAGTFASPYYCAVVAQNSPATRTSVGRNRSLGGTPPTMQLPPPQERKRSQPMSTGGGRVLSSFNYQRQRAGVDATGQVMMPANMDVTSPSPELPNDGVK